MTKKNETTTTAMEPGFSCPFRSAYSPRVRVALSFAPQGRTKQSFKAECDINNLMSRYLKTGVLDFVNKHAPQYQDVTGLDYQEAMDIVAHGNSMFNELPSKLRAEFDNDPALFLDFVSDPENAPEMAEMGLLTPEATLRHKNAVNAVAAPSSAPETTVITPSSSPSQATASPPKPSAAPDK